MRIIDDDLKELFGKYPVFEPAGRAGNWRCTLTKHELPEKELENYVETRKFLWAFEIHQLMEKYGEHFDELGPALFTCKLTGRKVARDPKDLERHINGKRFRHALDVEEERKRAAELVVTMEEGFGSPLREEEEDMAVIDEAPLPKPTQKERAGKRKNKVGDGPTTANDSTAEASSTIAGKRQKKQ